MNPTNTIKRLRESKGISQEELSERLNTTRSNYAYLEKRDKKLTIEQLEKIAGALGVSVLELLTGDAPAVADNNHVKELEARIKELEKHIRRSMSYSYAVGVSLVTSYNSFADQYGINATDGFFELSGDNKEIVCYEFLDTIKPFIALFGAANWGDFGEIGNYETIKTQLFRCQSLVFELHKKHATPNTEERLSKMRDDITKVAEGIRKNGTTQSETKKPAIN